MLESVIGFGRCGNVTDEYKISVEMKTVNHRYLDLSIKVPKKFNYLEAPIRTLLGRYIQGGRVDPLTNYEDYKLGNICLKYNRTLVTEYTECFHKIPDEFGIQNDAKTPALAKFSGVFTMEQVPDDEEHLRRVLLEAFKEAAVRFAESREIEGEHLKRDLLGKLGCMETLMDLIEERSPRILAEYRNRLEDKVKELLNNIAMEESRIAVEITICADKIYMDEETMRLGNHIYNTGNGFLSGEGVGCKLDFTVQETSREANTVLPRFTDLSILDKAIALKIKIEKIREQTQDIE